MGSTVKHFYIPLLIEETEVEHSLIILALRRQRHGVTQVPDPANYGKTLPKETHKK